MPMFALLRIGARHGAHSNGFAPAAAPKDMARCMDQNTDQQDEDETRSQHKLQALAYPCDSVNSKN